jgi:protein-disulfide isomerase
MRTAEGARKYQAMVDSRRKQARDRALYVNSSLGIVVALICVISIGVQAGRAKVAITTNPTNATVANGVVWGEKAAATVDVFEDFQCPHCLDFEQSTHTVLEADVRANKAQVRYHTMAFLDSASNGNNYSTRAANAALCMSDVSTDDFVAFHDILFSSAVQPKEGSNGRTNADFATYAQQAGLKPATSELATFNSCVTGQTYKPVVESITENASKRGVNATPTVMVNGKTLANPTLQSLEAAIAAADAKGPAPTPSKTPSPTPTSPSTSATPTKVTSTPTPSGT